MTTSTTDYAASPSGGAVASVNTKTGVVALTAADVGAAPAPYAIGAVHFDGANSSLVNAALVSADCEFFSFSYWFRVATSQSGKVIFAVDAEHNYGTNHTFSDVGIEILVADAPYDNHYVGSALDVPYPSEYHHIMGTAASNYGVGAKLLKVYVDNTDVSHISSDTHGAFFTGFNGLSLKVGDDGYGIGATMDMADFWLAPNQSLLVDGDIPEATRRKFITSYGTPVDLGISGATPTGASPAVFFHRAVGADASTFVNNLGAAGTFTLIGTLTPASANPPSVAPDIGFTMTAVGDMLIGGTRGAATRLAAGTEGQVLKMVSGVPTWVTP